MKKDKKYLDDDETVELNIDDLTEIQGGVEDEGTGESHPCGLGCFLGAWYK